MEEDEVGGACNTKCEAGNAGDILIEKCQGKKQVEVHARRWE
jgi:hypothetical protein